VAAGKRRRSPQVSPGEEGPPPKRIRGRDVEKSTPEPSPKRSSNATTEFIKRPTSVVNTPPQSEALLHISRQQSGSDVADSEVEIIENYLVETESSETKTSENGLDLLDPHTETSSELVIQDKGEPDDLFDESAGPTSEITPPHHSSPIASSPQIPSHRARAANPLIKIADDPNFKGMDGAISVKARLLRQGSPTSSGSALDVQARPKPKATAPSKGLQTRKSSLLVFQKGGLTTLKGKYSVETVTNNGNIESGEASSDLARIRGDDSNTMSDEIPGLTIGKDSEAQVLPASSAEELLKMAGLNAEAEALPDFEDECPMHEEPVVDNSPTWQRFAVVLSLSILLPTDLYIAKPRPY
jgi:hypothetical protein